MKYIFELWVKVGSNCEDLSSILIFHLQFKYMFHIFTFIDSSFMGTLLTELSSQLEAGRIVA